MFYFFFNTLYPYLCSFGSRHCRSNQVCSFGSVVLLCCEDTVDIRLSGCHRHQGHQGRCCYCRDTACSGNQVSSGFHRSQGCTCHSVDLRDFKLLLGLYLYALKQNSLSQSAATVKCDTLPLKGQNGALIQLIKPFG